MKRLQKKVLINSKHDINDMSLVVSFVLFKNKFRLSTSQGSAATYLRCSGKYNNVVANYIFSTSERILKIA